MSDDKALGVVVVVVVVGVAISLLVFAEFQKQETSRVERLFVSRANTYARVFQNALEQNAETLNSIAGLYAASQKVERAEFQTFLRFESGFGARVRAIAWIPRVADSERAAYEEDAQREGFAGYQFTERGPDGMLMRASTRAEYYPAYYVEPLRGNEAALGVDLGSEPIRRAALEQARDTGNATATPRITLIQETGGQYGFLVFKPMYRNGVPSTTVEERRQNLVGFALVVYSVGDLVQEILRNMGAEGIYGYIYDKSAPMGQQFFYYYSARGVQEAMEKDEERVKASAPMFRESMIHVSGRQWSLLLMPTPEYLAARYTLQAWFVLTTGLFLTGGLGAYLLSVSRHSARMEAEMTRRKYAEEELAKSEQKYRGLVEQTSDILWEIDERGTYTYVSPNVASFLGYGPGEMVGKTQFDFMPPEDALRIRGEFESIVAQKRAFSLLHSRMNSKDGRQFHFEVSGIPVLDSQRRLQGYRGVARDITERMRAEAAVRQMQEERMSTVNFLAGTTAHEINNPMSVVLGHVYLLKERSRDPSFPYHQIAPAVEAIEKAVAQVSATTRALLSFLRPGPAPDGTTDLHRLIDDAFLLLGPKLRGGNITVAMEVETSLPPVRGNHSELQQALLNLVLNSLQAMVGGGTLTLRARHAGDHVELEVADTGRGIPPQDLPRIFEPFFTTKPEGTGLGLPLVRSILRKFGGDVKVHSEVGRGTVFTLRLRVNGKPKNGNGKEGTS